METDGAAVLDWVPIAEGRVGCVVMNTAENLGVSPEALSLLKQIPRGRDSLGDVDWFSSVRGDCFSWLGGTKRIVDPSHAEGSRDYAIRSYVEISNNPPAEAVEYLESSR